MRHYLPSDKKWSKDNDKLQLHPSDEPFLCLLILNHRIRYEAQAKYFVDNTDTKTLPDKKKKSERGEDEPVDPMWYSEYTEQEGGLQRWGGWKSTAVPKYNELTQLYMAAKYVPVPKNKKVKKMVIKKEFLEWEKKVQALIKTVLEPTKAEQKKAAQDAEKAANGQAADEEEEVKAVPIDLSGMDF